MLGNSKGRVLGATSNIIRAALPVWNHQYGKAESMVPSCPKCGKDALTMMSSSYALCGNCRVWVERSGDLGGR
jgi:hypothetical protein